MSLEGLGVIPYVHVRNSDLVEVDGGEYTSSQNKGENVDFPFMKPTSW